MIRDEPTQSATGTWGLSSRCVQQQLPSDMQFSKVLLRNAQQLPGIIGGLPVCSQRRNQDQLPGDGLLAPANGLLGPGYEFQSMDALGDRRHHASPSHHLPSYAKPSVHPTASRSNWYQGLLPGHVSR